MLTTCSQQMLRNALELGRRVRHPHSMRLCLAASSHQTCCTFLRRARSLERRQVPAIVRVVHPESLVMHISRRWSAVFQLELRDLLPDLPLREQSLRPLVYRLQLALRSALFRRDHPIFHVEAQKPVSDKVLSALARGLLEQGKLAHGMLDFGQSRVEVLIDEQILVIAVFRRAWLTLAWHCAGLTRRVDVGKV